MTLLSSSLPSSTISEQQIPKWRIKADYWKPAIVTTAVHVTLVASRQAASPEL
ncbi:MAG: hypothetical protein WBE61_13680 [Nitrososphaeraceae archaeon]|jgi:hypothetical protein